MEKVGALASSTTLNYRTAQGTAGVSGEKDASEKLYVPESGNVGFAKRHQFIKNETGSFYRALFLLIYS